VQVRDALADGVVERDEAALRAERGQHRGAQPPHPGEQRADQAGREVGQGLVVLSRDDQRVALEHRPGVEECHGDIVI